METTNKYSKLFAIGKLLNMGINELRYIAEDYTGKQSLRSLSNAQLTDFENMLQRKLDREDARLRQKVLATYEENGVILQEQRDFLVDLIVFVFRGDIRKFRSWLEHYFQRSSERFLTPDIAIKIIDALNHMKSRKVRL